MAMASELEQAVLLLQRMRVGATVDHARAIDTVLAELARLRAVEWTDTMPAKSGWYFWKPSETTDKIFRTRLPEGVYRLEMGGIGKQELHLALPKDRNRHPAKWMGGLWFGRLHEPTAAAAAKGGG